MLSLELKNYCQKKGHPVHNNMSQRYKGVFSPSSWFVPIEISRKQLPVCTIKQSQTPLHKNCIF